MHLMPRFSTMLFWAVLAAMDEHELANTPEALEERAYWDRQDALNDMNAAGYLDSPGTSAGFGGGD